MLIINTSTIKVEVKITSPQGVDFVHIQPKGRVRLADNQKVDSNWLARSGKSIKIVEDSAAKVAASTSSSYPMSDEE